MVCSAMVNMKRLSANIRKIHDSQAWYTKKAQPAIWDYAFLT